jgi:glycerol-3-phosphate acyltransferase PlsY
MLRLLPQWCLVNEIATSLELSSDQGMIVSAVAILLCAVLGYLLGSLNSAILISHTILRRDIRAHGSKNAGTTNMLRTYGTGYAVLTLALDMLKGALAALIGFLVAHMVGAPVAGFFCVFGHMFPLYYRFRGGKGVATTGMVALMLDPWVFLVMLGVFVIITAGTRYVSLASVMCALLYPLLLHAFIPGGWTVLMGLMTTVFVVFMHRENIKRLLAGKESKISFGKKKTADTTSTGTPTGGAQE